MGAIPAEEFAAFNFGEHASLRNVDTIANSHDATVRKNVQYV
jgi:hypothetical protein